MARKYKSTGCARLFLVLLIVAPIAFFVASYINGSDPMETLGNLFGSKEEVVSPKSSESATEGETADFQDQIRRLQKDVEYYKIEAETYKKLLKECQDARLN